MARRSFGLFRVDAPDLAKAGEALRNVGQETKTKIIVRALNRTGDSAFTQIKRVLASQTGLKVGRVASVMTKDRAHAGSLKFIITAKDKWTRITAGNFGARETKVGVSHRAWNRLTRAEGSFMIGSVAVTRKSSARLPLKSLYGPNVAREMVRGNRSLLAAQKSLGDVFVPRVLHEVDRELKKQKARYGL